MQHIYSCEKLNYEKEEVNFEKVYTGTITEQIKILKRFRNNMEKRTKLKTIIPCDRLSDPLISALEISSGNKYIDRGHSLCPTEMTYCSYGIQVLIICFTFFSL